MASHVRYSLVLTILTLAAFAHVCGNGFIDLDDDTYITVNLHIQEGLTWENVRWAFTASYANFWIPLTWLSLQLDATLFGPNAAWGFHLTNLLLHLANVLLLYRVLAFMTLREGPSFWVAALFAVHPLHVESVAWATERKDVLSTFFWLLSMGAYAWYALEPNWKRMTLTALLLALGLMAKPMPVTLPFALLLMDFWPLRRCPRSDAPSRFATASPGRLIAEKLPLFAIAFTASFVTFSIKREWEEVVDLSLSARLVNAVTSYGWYLWKTVVPIRLGVFYSHPLEEYELLPAIVSCLVLAAITFLAVRSVRGHPYLLIGWLWFLGTLVPVLGLVQVGTQARADRFVYVPHIGLFLALVWLCASQIQDRPWLLSPLRVIGALLLLVLTALTWLQVRHWKNTSTLWEHTLEVTGGDPQAVTNRAMYLTAEGRPDSLQRASSLLDDALRVRERADLHFWKGAVLGRMQRYPEAIRHYERALELTPQYAMARQALGYLLLLQGQKEEAAAHFTRVLEQDPGAAVSNLYLGVLLLQKGEVDRGAEHLRKALKGKCDHALAHTQLGILLLRQGDLDSAEEHFRLLADLQPESGSAEYYLGLVHTRRREWPQAVARLTRAAPHHPRFRCALAYALIESGNKEEAAKEYEIVSRLHPDWLSESANSAERIATHANPKLRDPQEAFELALQACQATEFRNPRLLDVLAVTQAARGEFSAAEKTAADALTRATEDVELTRRIQQRLLLYQNKQPVPPEQK